MYKELRLAAHPTLFVFLIMAAMLLIPAYPYHVLFFYTTLAIFMTCIYGRENNDILYTLTLPVAKKDAVKARICLGAVFELAQIMLCVPFMLMSIKLHSAGGGNPVGLDANLALLGSGFVMYAVFNFVFYTSFYKTAYKAGRAFIFASIAMSVYILAVEALSHTVLSAFDGASPEALVKQIPILAAGVVIWLFGLFVTYKKAAASFEKVDL